MFVFDPPPPWWTTIKQPLATWAQLTEDHLLAIHWLLLLSAEEMIWFDMNTNKNQSGCIWKKGCVWEMRSKRSSDFPKHSGILSNHSHDTFSAIIDNVRWSVMSLMLVSRASQVRRGGGWGKGGRWFRCSSEVLLGVRRSVLKSWTYSRLNCAISHTIFQTSFGIEDQGRGRW